MSARPADPTLDDIHVSEYPSEYIDRMMGSCHYLGSAPAGAIYRYIITAGIMWGECGGAMWGRPVARLEDQERTLELTRFWTPDWTPKNTESYSLAWMLRDLKSRGSHDRLIAYASTGQGHEGGIYKATNWIDLGVRDTHGGDGWENRQGRENVDSSPKRKFVYYLSWEGWFWHSLGRRVPVDWTDRFVCGDDL